MSICSRKCEVILVLTVVSQDSRSELELLPGALCAQGTSTKLSDFLGGNLSQQTPPWHPEAWLLEGPGRGVFLPCRAVSSLAGQHGLGCRPFVSAMGRIRVSRKQPQHIGLQ